MSGYTVEILRQRINAYKILHVSCGLNDNIRRPNFPEDISENIVRFHIGDTCAWRDGPGDLYCSHNGKIEVKCFTSDGPISFGPKEDWDELYVVDAREFYRDKYTIHRIKCSSNDPDWMLMSVNNKQTFRDQIKQKRRPRMSPSRLLSEMKKYIETHEVEY